MFRSKNSIGLSYVDYLTFMVACLSVLFCLAFIKMAKIINDANMKEKAEFIVEIDWDEGSNNDVDLWMLDPANNILNFKNRQVGLMSLDHDNQGTTSERVTLQDGTTKQVEYRREVGTIRGIIPGKYTINIQMYSYREPLKPSPVKISIKKLNPYSEVMTKVITLDQQNQEETVVNMILDNNGKVVSLDQERTSLVALTIGK